MNKRALLGFKKINFAVNMIFLAVVVFTVVFFINSFFTITFDTSKAEAEIMTARVLFSPNGISYCDNSCHPGIIDYKYFSNNTLSKERFSKAFDFDGNSLINFKLDLIADNKSNIGTVYFVDEQEYLKFKGFESFSQFEHVQKSYYVLYNKDNKLHKGRLDLDLVMEVE